jgi:hypothetical protein
MTRRNLLRGTGAALALSRLNAAENPGVPAHRLPENESPCDEYVYRTRNLHVRKRGPNILRADSLKQVDLTLLKMFPITERTALQFRAEMFNILNHPVFAIPNNTINNSSGGQVSSTLNSARIVQLALKLSF